MTTSKLSRRTALAAGLSTAMFPNALWAQASTREVEGGIGGTGIVGVITDFDRLVVSGNQLGVDANTRLSDGFGEVDRTSLRLGDSLTIEAAGPPDALLARRIHVTHPLVGAIGAILAGGSRLTVNGVEVVLPDPEPTLAIGKRVAVAGLWQGAFVIASRVSQAQSDRDLISGDVRRSFGRVQLGPIAMRGRGITGLPNGSFATASGQYDPERQLFRVEALTPNRFTEAAGSLGRLSIEGYLEPTPTAPGYRVSGLGHSFARNLQLSRYKDVRVLFNGAYTGKFAANRALVLPDNVQARRSLLASFSRTAG
ncbi:DUF5666 domain-containing protein [Roseobacter sp.]|uniref:DUF5666 domain-containing protein n=1 Tax=Roseobacter sp. TaxID=1907202 RepID=UPI00385B9280